MATILPNYPVKQTPPLSARLFRVLRQLPEDYIIWHRLFLDSSPKQGPDFLVLEGGLSSNASRALFLKVSGLSAQNLLSARQGELFPDLESSTANDSLASFQSALNLLDIWVKQSLGSEFARTPQTTQLRVGQEPLVPIALVFPKLSRQDLGELLSLLKQYPGANNYPVLVQEDLDPLRLEESLKALVGPEVSAEEFVAIRLAFAPESALPKEFTALSSESCVPEQQKLQTAATPLLLDLIQESIVKSDLTVREDGEEPLELALSEDGQRMSRDMSLQLISGVAGSGKSLIVLYRAKLLRSLYPKKSLVVFTHNKPLMNELRYRYRILARHDTEAKWFTFYRWCYSLLPKERRWKRPISERMRQTIMREVISQHTLPQGISITMALDELDWCKDRLLFSVDAYVQADRSGRRFPLPESSRRALFSMFEEYQKQIYRLGRVEWGDIPRQLFRLVERQKLQLPCYDFILVDEAQFFAPLWFELIKRSLKPRFGSLFLVADPSQGFLKRGNSWLSVGLEVRGKVRKLARSYRTTKKILEFALRFSQLRGGLVEEAYVEPELEGMREGTKPHVILLSSPQDEVARVIIEVSSLLAQGISPGSILIIHPDWMVVKEILRRLQSTIGPNIAVDAREGAVRGKVSVCLLKAATGLESPIVFLLGSYRLLEQEENPELSSFQMTELAENNTRCLYMAMTRAGQRLVVTWVGNVPQGLRDLLIT